MMLKFVSDNYVPTAARSALVTVIPHVRWYTYAYMHVTIL